MNFSDLLGGVSEFLNLDDIAGSFISENFGDFIGDFGTQVLSGAVTNAAIAGIAGGDIAKAALWGGAGGALGVADLGGFGQDVGNFVSGYGLAESMDGDGLIGGVSSVIGGRLSTDPEGEEGTYKERTGGSDGATGGDESGDQGGTSSVVKMEDGKPSISGSLNKKLQDLGIINSEGQGTLLGKAIVGGIAGMTAQKNTEDLLEMKHDQAKDRDAYQAKLEHENDMKRINAFNNRGFTVVRNG